MFGPENKLGFSWSSGRSGLPTDWAPGVELTDGRQHAPSPATDESTANSTTRTRALGAQMGAK